MGAVRLKGTGFRVGLCLFIWRHIFSGTCASQCLGSILLLLCFSQGLTFLCFDVGGSVCLLWFLRSLHAHFFSKRIEALIVFALWLFNRVIHKISPSILVVKTIFFIRLFKPLYVLLNSFFFIINLDKCICVVVFSLLIILDVVLYDPDICIWVYDVNSIGHQDHD